MRRLLRREPRVFASLTISPSTPLSRRACAAPTVASPPSAGLFSVGAVSRGCVFFVARGEGADDLVAMQTRDSDGVEEGCE